MKLNENFIIHEKSDGIYIVPTASAKFSGFIRGNRSVMTIIKCLMKETTEEEIVKTLMEKYDGKKEDMRADVSDVIKKLKKIGAID